MEISCFNPCASIKLQYWLGIVQRLAEISFISSISVPLILISPPTSSPSSPFVFISISSSSPPSSSVPSFLSPFSILSNSLTIAATTICLFTVVISLFFSTSSFLEHTLLVLARDGAADIPMLGRLKSVEAVVRLVMSRV